MGVDLEPLAEVPLRALQASAEDPGDLVVDVPRQRVGGRQPGIELERLADASRTSGRRNSDRITPFV